MIDPQALFQKMIPPVAEGCESLAWTVRGDLPYMEGHFPQNPILPAIAIIDISTYILQSALRSPELQLKAVVSAKFMSPIVPETQVQIAWQKIKEQTFEFSWKDSNARTLASLSLQF